MTAALPMRPPWLRPAAIVAAVALHASLAMLVAVKSARPPPSPPEIEVTLDAAPTPQPLGPSAETPAPDLSTPAPAQMPAPPATPEASPPPVATPPPAVAAQAPGPDLPTPEPPPVATAPPPTRPPSPPPQSPAPARAAPRPAPAPKPSADARDAGRLAQQKKEAARREDARKTRETEDALRAREANAAPAKPAGPTASPETHASAGELAAYASALFAEIARHKSSAGLSASGSVGVSFTVGASGRIVSHAITQGSGDGALDARVHVMMQAVQAPPPPGGRFNGHITIRFSGSE